MVRVNFLVNGSKYLFWDTGKKIIFNLPIQPLGKVVNRWCFQIVLNKKIIKQYKFSSFLVTFHYNRKRLD